VEHDARIDDNCHISTGAIVNGDCRLGRNVFLGSNAVLRNGVSVCADAVIGAGTVVVRSLEVPGTYVGVPGRLLSG
jgi:carbonic anhydrase/acetyltransferase-like protein (isoleucine patch superfamily)